MKKQVQWDLLPDEREQLRQKTLAKIGNIKLIEAVQRTLGQQAVAEAAWWEAVRLRIGVPKKDAGGLCADHTIGKVWIKGEVKSLDKDDKTELFDNPCL